MQNSDVLRKTSRAGAIYENDFPTDWVKEETLFRYAGRRKVAKKLCRFFTAQTKIELIQLLAPNGVLESRLNET